MAMKLERWTDEAGDASAIGNGFKPYVLWRRGMLPFRELRQLVPRDTWEAIRSLEEERRDREELAERLTDHLYDLVPTLAPDPRHRALQVRRDLHNDRRLDEADAETVAGLLDAEALEAFRAWRRSRRRHERLREDAVTRLEEESEEARSALAGIASRANFLKGVQLSGRQLYRSVRNYVTGEVERDPKLERTIVRYAYRMSLRTTPFGSFTEVGARPWRARGETASAAIGRRRRVSINRGLLTWMVHALRQIDDTDGVLRLRLNNTLRPVEGRLEAFTRGMDGSENAYWGEGFVDVEPVGPVRVVTGMLSGGPRPKSEVVEALADHGMSAGGAASVVDRLVEAGVCHLDLGIPDQTTDFAAEARERLEAAESATASELADVFETLHDAARRFSTATLPERERCLDELEEEVERFAELCGASDPLSMTRTLLYEDVAAEDRARSWAPDALDRNAKHFARFQRLLPLLDDTTFERLGLYRWFVSNFGRDGRCEDVVTLYRAFSSQSRTAISEIMQGLRSPAARRVRDARREVLRRLDDAVAGVPGSGELRLEEACVDAAIEDLPEAVPWSEEAAYRLQLSDGGAGGTAAVVLNEVASGHGVFLSRFCDLVEPDDPGAWSLRRSLRRTIGDLRPRQADLTAVLSLNVNLHPPLAPLEVVYPGSVASEPEDALTLRDLAVVADSERRTLRFVDRRDGRPVRLTPMNFLFPAAAPLLYRFLCALSPLHTYRVGLWDRLRRWSDRTMDRLPRLILGDVVIERRRWFLPASEVEEAVEEAACDTVSSLVAARRWFRGRGLPRETFFRVHRKGDETDEDTTWIEATRNWAENARDAGRKRQYLDARNPSLLRLLFKEVEDPSAGLVEFQECLPPTSVYPGKDGPDAAEEFVVEFRRPRSDP